MGTAVPEIISVHRLPMPHCGIENRLPRVAMPQIMPHFLQIRRKKEAGTVVPTSQIGAIFLLEVTLQQAFQTTAVAGLVAGHLQWNGGFA